MFQPRDICPIHNCPLTIIKISNRDYYSERSGKSRKFKIKYRRYDDPYLICENCDHGSFSTKCIYTSYEIINNFDPLEDLSLKTKLFGVEGFSSPENNFTVGIHYYNTDILVMKYYIDKQINRGIFEKDNSFHDEFAINYPSSDMQLVNIKNVINFF